MHAESKLAKAASGFVGQRIERLEDDALLLGRGCYADATTSVRTRTPGACAATGTSRATPATWTPTATCS